MSDVLGKGGGGGGGHHHHGGGGGRGWGGGWGWGGYPYGYGDYLFDTFEEPVPEYTTSIVDGKVVLTPVVSTQVPAADIMGMVDVGAWQAQMNTLKQVPVSVARILIKNGADAIVRAQTVAKQLDLPGVTARVGVQGHLQWHADTLANLTDPNAMYASGNDLKKWVLAAYVEANAAEEGATWVNSAWSKMWNEIGAAIAALPKVIAAKVNETAGALFGMPGWVVGVSVLGALLLGVGIYSKSMAKGHGGK